MTWPVGGKDRIEVGDDAKVVQLDVGTNLNVQPKSDFTTKPNDQHVTGNIKPHNEGSQSLGEW